MLMSSDSMSDNVIIVHVCDPDRVCDPSMDSDGRCCEKFCVCLHSETLEDEDVSRLQKAAIHYMREYERVNDILLHVVPENIRRLERETSDLRQQLYDRMCEINALKQQMHNVKRSRETVGGADMLSVDGKVYESCSESTAAAEQRERAVRQRLSTGYVSDKPAVASTGAIASNLYYV